MKDLTDLRKLLVNARLPGAHPNVDATISDMIAAMPAPPAALLALSGWRSSTRPWFACTVTR